MKKIKLNIKGMHCNACSTLIENELNEHKGISMAKVSHETGKAVVVYDEDKITSNDIGKLVEKAGDYKMEEGDDDSEEDRHPSRKKRKLEKSEVFFRVMMVIIALGTLAIIIMFINKEQATNGPLVVTSGSKNIVNNNRPTPAPTPSPGGIVDIAVSKTDNIRGNKDAPITIVEFSDFQCPYCSSFHDTMKQIIADYPDDVRWVYKHFPLDSIHPFARKVSEASECAAEQNKFWEYADEVFSSKQQLTVTSLSSIAETVGLNVKKFDSCLESGKYEDKVETDRLEGVKLGVRGTPGNFINGKLLAGAVPYATLATEIDNLLKQE